MVGNSMIFYKSKKIMILFFAFVCIFITSCSGNNVSQDDAKDAVISVTQNIATDTTEIYENEYELLDADVLYKSNKNFKIYTNASETIFCYYIYDNNGGLIDIGYHDWRGSFDIWMDDTVLVLEYGFGGSSWYRRYYDTEQGMVSRYFYKPVATYQDLVAYFTTSKEGIITLIIQNMFDTTDYYLEINRKFSDLVIKDQCEAEFINEGTQLLITYWIADDEAVSEIIDLI